MDEQQKNKTILIVEDEAALRGALSDKFKRAGFSVLEARNGEEGLEVATREHPDLILLDVMMPVMSGMAMLKQLREDAWGKSARVIILTNLNDAEYVAEAMKQESYDYFIKSDWKIEDLVAKVREKLEK
ncbi:response regulator [Patescibacteria group bacterium]|nr:response regulator [Patescibacteria group bacterium]MBU4338418.1 response regulator [Patescibacteria group bacterium]MBU4579491.1 response regulator [Patescibacteria group bacterium]